MSSFYHTQLRIIQALPQNTSKVAIYLMLGALPFEEMLDLQMLTLFGAICRLPKSNKLYQLARRQLTSDHVSPISWFRKLQHLADSYSIDACQNMLMPEPKQRWKKQTSEAIKLNSLEKMTAEAKTRQTLSWVIWSESWLGDPHPIWQACRGDAYGAAGASARLKMLVGRYPLQRDRYEFRTAKSPLCLLCNSQEEDIVHMLLQCNKSKHLSQHKINILKTIYIEQGCKPPSNEFQVTSAILNGWAYAPLNAKAELLETKEPEMIALKTWDNASILCSNICLKMDKFRSKELEILKQCDVASTKKQ